MKYLLIVATALCFISCKKTSTDIISPVITTDSFTVTVNNGYGAGKYKIGDTVHIFSTAYTDAQVFDKWAGADVNLLNAFEGKPGALNVK